MKLVLDPGSCHLNRMDYAQELIDLAIEVGADAIKFQLLDPFWRRGLIEGNLPDAGRDKFGNILLEAGMFEKLVGYVRRQEKHIEIFASCFTEEGIQLLSDVGISKVKLAYSQAFNLRLIRKARNLGMKIWASGDENHYPGYADIKLFCIPEYPPKRHPLNYETRGNFQGFSSHFLGYDADKMYLEMNPPWKILEKHITLDHDDIDVPDHFIALLPKELKAMTRELNGK